ncbi:PAS modulated sigma54 specific transcriptional regulator, Fis family [Candidatus Vecturithrix granuli]|uniref:PAS modulated sigma54 specific transcriptional regulator, Fis family n=1 Tax=Vecturithrix granuli TaxID=1499967 RepID=A0A081C7M8_VECG1|nr:PAS modulated sigma54 specific transcriptional regulator, Fis family [Candidatus Vecturithrix granuli]
MSRFHLRRIIPTFLKKTSFQTILILVFAAQVVATACLTGYLAFRNGLLSVNDVANQLRSEMTARITQHLHTYLDTPHLINTLNINAIHLKQIDIIDFSTLEHQFWKQSQIFPSVSYIYFASERTGDFIGVKRLSNDTFHLRNGSGPTFSVFTTDAQGNRGELLSVMPYVDSRTRPWYQAAKESGKAIWSPVYTWVGSPNISIDAVCPVYNDSGTLEGVFGVSLILADINEFLKNLKVGTSGQTFIMEQSGLLISTSSTETGMLVNGETAERVHATESENPFIRLTVQYLKESGSDPLPHEKPTPVSIKHIRSFDLVEIDGKRQFGQVTPFQDKWGLDWLIVVLIPEDEFMMQVYANTQQTFILSLLALFVAVGIGGITARWVIRPLARLNIAAQALARGEWEQHVLIDREDEVGQLAKSFHTMATQLRESFAELDQNEQQYRFLVEHVADGIGIFQKERLVFVNDAFAALLDFPQDQLIGKIPEELFGKDYLSRYKKIQKQLQVGVLHPDWQIFEFALMKNDQKMWLEGRHKMILWEGAQAILVSIRDVTIRKRQEEENKATQKKLRQENIRLRSTIKDRYKFENIIGKSFAMQEVYELVLKAAATDTNVVIYGESGTGKDLVAQTIHRLSDRQKMTFVPVNCGSIQETLFESEFFGYRKGAFTGALRDKPGFFDAAHNGTLFLDEVGELGLNMQVKLLRAIEGGGYTPVGDQTVKHANVRIIAATNRNLSVQIQRGEMRSDFFYRINVITINVPPLRERREDIPLLVEYFLHLYGNKSPIQTLPGHILEALYNHDWPGNVRQLQNVLQRYLTLKSLDFGNGVHYPEISRNTQDNSRGFTPTTTHLHEAIAEFEKHFILSMLTQNQGRKNKTADILGIPARTLRRKLSKYHPK